MTADRAGHGHNQSRGIRLGSRRTMHGGRDGDASRQSHSGQLAAEASFRVGVEVEVESTHRCLLLGVVVAVATRFGVAVRT